jgi:outer membrane lipoprotein carrier protein
VSPKAVAVAAAVLSLSSSLPLPLPFTPPAWGADSAAKAAPQKKSSSKPSPSAATAKPVDASTHTYSLPLQPAPTIPLTVDVVVAGIETIDLALKTLSADFKQSVKWDDSGMAQSVEGTVEFSKPERLRLEHRIPEPQTLVSDGDVLWVHRPSTNQVIKTRLSEWKKSEPMAQGLLDFGNYAGLVKRYEVDLSTQGAADADGHRQVELRLRPREKSAAGDFTLWLVLSTRDWFPAEARLRAGAVTVRSLFSRIRYNAPIPGERFTFAPPPGADLFDTVKPKAK